jgi:hypothetical protein
MAHRIEDRRMSSMYLLLRIVLSDTQIGFCQISFVRDAVCLSGNPIDKKGVKGVVLYS